MRLDNSTGNRFSKKYIKYLLLSIFWAILMYLWIILLREFGKLSTNLLKVSSKDLFKELLGLLKVEFSSPEMSLLEPLTLSRLSVRVFPMGFHMLLLMRSLSLGGIRSRCKKVSIYGKGLNQLHLLFILGFRLLLLVFIGTPKKI